MVKALREKAAGEDCEGFEFELLGPKALWHVELKWGMCAVGVERRLKGHSLDVMAIAECKGTGRYPLVDERGGLQKLRSVRDPVHSFSAWEGSLPVISGHGLEFPCVQYEQQEINKKEFGTYTGLDSNNEYAHAMPSASAATSCCLLPPSIAVAKCAKASPVMELSTVLMKHTFCYDLMGPENLKNQCQSIQTLVRQHLTCSLNVFC